ncbi:MAG: hypothetical protein AB1916_10265 [Thermodesulfobacteriota bacterium]
MPNPQQPMESPMQKASLLTVTLGILLAYAAGFSGDAHAQQRIEKKEFSITLPDGWVEIPRNNIDHYLAYLRELAPAARPPHFEYVFQMSPEQTYFTFPYITIILNTQGKMSRSDLRDITAIPINSYVEKQKEAYSPVYNHLEVGKLYLDETANIIWTRSEADISGHGEVSGISAIIPTEAGAIQVTGFALKHDFATYEPVFCEAFLSINPAPELVYKP